MSNFTPGPWEIKLYPYPSRRRKKPCIGISSRHARDFIAQYIKSDADARLIVAAPEMYDLLEDAGNYLLDLIHDKETIDDESRDAFDAALKIGALLRRIKGEDEETE